MTGTPFDEHSEQVDDKVCPTLPATKSDVVPPAVGHAFESISNHRVQLRRFIKFLTSGSRGWGDYYAEQGDVFVRIGNLPRQSLQLGGELQRVDLPPHVREGQRTRLREADLLFSITAYIGSVAVVESGWIDAYVSQHVALCRLDLARLDPRFVGYFMLGTEGQDQLLQGAVGGTKVQLALDDIRGLRIPVPPLAEQQRIAAHLDRELAKIDTLIAAQERFVGFVRERRGAVVDLLLKEAGEYRQVPLRYVAGDITVGIVVQPSRWYVDNGVPALRGVNVRPGRIMLDDLVFISDDGHRQYRKSQLSAGDVVVVRTGQSGAAAVIPESLDGANAIDLLVIKPGNRLLGSYLEMVLNAPATRERSSVEVVGSIQGHLNVAALRALTIPVPPVDKQQEMVDRWHEQAGEIDTLIASTKRHIELAKERRIALITAAVTGQIDIPKGA
ncbi:restriction endonuclease subunit S [Streptomyces europaeiscabiei]|uniref:restriction endonuclease subunit S n=1 Tax=Streptomyces europaeiscabiei TaxID=146819 RepID=UPI002E15D1F4|nr:restriction endonuclease subunit S [Streptomyces europaeiscabiei]